VAGLHLSREGSKIIQDHQSPLGAAIGFRHFGGAWGMPFDGYLSGALFGKSP
jgi:hypothetical protein